MYIATDVYQGAIEIQPDWDEVWNARGNALSELDKWEEAIASYDRVIELNPGDVV